jgi:vacuolar-type H+-ATPase subunit E/Vma4
VRPFCAAYGLNVSQRETADSILRELREEAAKYREAHKADFEKLETDFAEIAKRPGDSKEDQQKNRDDRIALNKRQQRLEEAISVGMYNRLKDRLENIPTSDQRKLRDEHVSRMQRRAASRPAGATRPASTDSQPAQAAAN